MSVKDVGNGWKEYYVYHGSACYPPEDTFRYNEATDELLLRAHHSVRDESKQWVPVGPDETILRNLLLAEKTRLDQASAPHQT